MRVITLFFYLCFFINIYPAYSYIGPGMAGGIFTSIVGIFIALFMIIVGIIYYPLKRYLKKRGDKLKTLDKDENNR